MLVSPHSAVLRGAAGGGLLFLLPVRLLLVYSGTPPASSIKSLFLVLSAHLDLLISSLVCSCCRLAAVVVLAVRSCACGSPCGLAAPWSPALA